MAGFAGDNCATNVDDCSSRPCRHGGQCTDGIDAFRCQCASGYGGSSCETETDECNSEPCLNAGSCVDSVNSYSCECKIAYDGDHCDVPVNVCDRREDNCDRNFGVCIHIGPGAHRCECNPGYSTQDRGATCTDVDDCLSVPCQHGARCADGVDAYTCTCSAGWTGDNCETGRDECASMPCQNGARCRDEIDKYSCLCPPGYGGSNCADETDECLSAPCENGASCIDRHLAYDCDCSFGWEGPTCAASIDPCSRVEMNQCDPVNAYCEHLGPGLHTCTCNLGFRSTNNGAACLEVNECLSAPCQHGGTCIDGRDSFTCSCAPGWIGVVCHTEVDECASHPCEHKGQCTDSIDSWSCSCRPGFAGERCLIRTDLCTSSPCQNGAVCAVGQAGGLYVYTCTCVPGFTGGDCEGSIDECASNPCNNGARCEDGVNAYVCDCSSGYIGSNCQTTVNHCVAGTDRCDRAHGECIWTGPGTHVCQCDEGFATLDAGSTCTEVDECVSLPCLHHGQCHDAKLSYSCRCLSGFAGANCEADVDDCASTPCDNRGRCMDGVDAYSCACIAGFSGDNCDVDIDECAGRNECANRGTCVDHVNFLTCTCRAGYTGRICETDIDECASTPCQHGGFCSEPSIGTYICACNARYSGDNCAELAADDGGAKPPPPPTDGSISCEQTVTGVTSNSPNLVGNPAGDYTLSFVLVAGTWTVEFDACNSQFDTVLRIMSPDLGTEIQSCDDCGPCGTQTILDTIIGCTEPLCEYTLVVEGYENDSGPFAVTMHCGIASAVEGAITCGNTVTGQIEAQDGTGAKPYFYTFQTIVDSAVQFDSCASDFDTFLRIYSNDMMNELHSCDDCGPCGTRTVLDAQLPAGNYVLVIEGYQQSAGDYSVTMNCPGSGDFIDGAITCDDTVTGTTVASGSHVGNLAGDHVYTFSIPEGTHLVQFDSCDSLFDTWLRIMTPDLSTQLASCDDCGPCGRHAVLDAELTCDQPTCDYALLVEGYQEDEGEYTIVMRCVVASQFEGDVQCGDVAVGDTVGAVASGVSDGADHFFNFTLNTNKLVQFDSCSSSYDTFLRIFSEDLATELHSCDDCGDCGTRSILDASLPAGRYVLVVGGWQDSEGEYSVKMNCPREGSGFIDGVIHCDQTVVGTTVSVGNDVGNGAGDHIYRFKVNQGSTAVHFNSCDSDFDTYLRIMSEDLTV
jgi:hypothetical protein